MKKFVFFILLTAFAFASYSQDGSKEMDVVFTKVEKEAKFPGGADAWVSFLMANLDANVAANDGAPVGIHTVKVQFIVDKEGNVRNVRAVDVPRKCPTCGIEAERVLRRSPKWDPATQNNRAVNYQALQMISFQVEKEKRKSRRSN